MLKIIIDFVKLFFWLLLIPEFIGLLLLKISKKENKNMIFAWILGNIFGFMIFELLAIPMTFLKFKFTTLMTSWAIIEISIFIISLIKNNKNVKTIIKDNIMKIKTFPKLLFTLFAILLFIQCYIPFRYMHEDYDDSNFVAKAAISIDTNSLFKYDDIGNENSSFPTRQMFSPFQVYTATISRLVEIRPAIVARTIFPPVFIFMAYMVYAMIGDYLFKEDKEKTFVFLIVLSFIYMWGAYSLDTNFIFLLYRVWQGKAILSNIMLPFIWFIFLKYINKDSTIFSWLLLLITLWGADLLSSMALSLATLTTAILSLIWTIKDKKIGYLLKTALCFIPSIIYGIIFIIIK